MLLIQTNAIADALNSSEWVFPIAECFHIAAFAWSIGLIAAVDYRLLGFGIQHSKPSEVLRATAPWTLLGLAVVLLSGPILFLSDVRMYLHNPSFVFKMFALAAAILYNYTIHRKVAQSDGSSQGVRVVVAVVSLALWVSVVFGGLFIAFASGENYDSRTLSMAPELGFHDLRPGVRPHLSGDHEHAPDLHRDLRRPDCDHGFASAGVGVPGA